MVLWNFLHKKFPPSAQDKKTILPPQAVPLPLQGRLNVSLTGQHPPNLPHKGGRKRRHKQIARLRNKCAMTDYGHAKLVSVSCGLNPSPAFQAPSPQVARGKIRSRKHERKYLFRYGLFTIHHSPFTKTTSLYSCRGSNHTFT